MSDNRAGGDQAGDITASDGRASGGGPLSWASLGTVYVMWGLTYLAIRVGVEHLPPLLMAGIRYVIAGGLLYGIARRTITVQSAAAPPAAPSAAQPAVSSAARRRLGARAWAACAVVGILLLVGGNGLVSIAETTLPSGLAAILVATVPLWMLVFARFLQHEPVAFRSAAGLVLGLAGVAVLVGGGIVGGRGVGVFIVLAASASWGLGSVLSHRLALPAHAMLAAAMEMLVAGAVLLIIAACAGDFSRVRWSSVPLTGWLALAYLIGPGSILAFTAYGYALAHLPVSTVATYAYVNPVVAVLAGIVFLGEQFTWHEAIGAVLVIGSIAITLNRPNRTPAAPADDSEPGHPVATPATTS